MKSIHYLVIATIGVIGISCQGKKFDYNSAYKFESPKTEALIPATENEIHVALEAYNPTITMLEISHLNKNLTSNFTQTKPEVKRMSSSEEMISGLRQKEKKIVRKIEKKIQRKLEASPAFDSGSMDGRIYTGIIIGAAGLVLMILAGGTVGSIGALGLLVGVILIVWGLLDP